MNKDQICKRAVNTYGETPQIHMAIEEMSELTKELCKVMRYADPKDSDAAKKLEDIHEHIKEEIADVKIMLAQMELIFGSADEYEEQKLERLCKRLNEHTIKSMGTIKENT